MAWAIRSWSLILGERPEQIAHGCSFLVSDLSNLLTSLIFLNTKSYIKHSKKLDFRFFYQKCLSELLIRSFIMSDLSESLTVAHLSWATWAICSRLLICLEQPEHSLTVAHFPWAIWANRSQSFMWFEWNEQMNDSLTVAHFCWAIWANRSQSLIWFERKERMSDEQMSEFPALPFALRNDNSVRPTRHIPMNLYALLYMHYTSLL